MYLKYDTFFKSGIEKAQMHISTFILNLLLTWPIFNILWSLIQAQPIENHSSKLPCKLRLWLEATSILLPCWWHNETEFIILNQVMETSLMQIYHESTFLKFASNSLWQSREISSVFSDIFNCKSNMMQQ